MKRVLVVEDEDAIRDFEVINLKRMGYEVTDVADGDRAWEIFLAEGGNFDVVLLDIMMPGIDGLTLCKKIRGQNAAVGIIMLSAKTQEMDKVSALMYGADDYVTKPFGPAELVARVDAVHRRVTMLKGMTEKPAGDMLVSGDFVLNLQSRSLTKGGKPIDLTQVEFQIMEFFMSREDVALERNEILAQVWGEDYTGDVKIVDVNVRRLRMKVEDEPSEPTHILTVWGYGYRWKG
ncbi:MAG: response regulator transcription factor [Oscillospiraceae bacterium]|nr:response regulator transcription factor [Oscillospiraceae bacterium]